MVRTTGEAFDHFDNRLIALSLVRNDITEVAIFDKSGVPLHASEFLYRKELMVIRGHFRPPTKVTKEAIEYSFEQFKEESSEPDKCMPAAELTMENLNRFGPITDQEYLDRVRLLMP